jgi:LEA14-like dessication related protein
MKKLLPLGAIAAGIFILTRYLSGRKTAMENLRVVPVSISIDSARSRNTFFTQLFYRVKLNLINNEAQPVIVRGIDLNIFYKSKQVGKIIRDQDFIIPGRGAQIVEMDASISASDIITSIVDIAQNIRNLSKIEFTINGFVDTDLGRIPVNFKRNINA